MTPPIIASWNLALRFFLELGGIAGLGIASWKLIPVPFRWIAAIGIPVAAVVIWGVFNVEGDTSRSGNAPIQVPGWIRLVIEITILGGAAAGLFLSGHRFFAFTYIAFLLIHYTASWRRIVWLLNL